MAREKWWIVELPVIVRPEYEKIGPEGKDPNKRSPRTLTYLKQRVRAADPKHAVRIIEDRLEKLNGGLL